MTDKKKEERVKTDEEALEIIAEIFKSQYFKHRKWLVYEDWEIQPQGIYEILTNLKKLKPALYILDRSWFRGFKKNLKRE